MEASLKFRPELKRLEGEQEKGPVNAKTFSFSQAFHEDSASKREAEGILLSKRPKAVQGTTEGTAQMIKKSTARRKILYNK